MIFTNGKAGGLLGNHDRLYRTLDVPRAGITCSVQRRSTSPSCPPALPQAKNILYFLNKQASAVAVPGIKIYHKI